jgi:hypothetical protein
VPAAAALPTAESDGVYGIDPGLPAPERGDYRLGETAARALHGAGPRPPAAGERDAGASVEAVEAAEAAAEDAPDEGRGAAPKKR